MTTEPFADRHVVIEATQNRICKTEGRREWSIYFDGRAVDEMTAKEAHRLAAALLDAADALDASQGHHAEPVV